MRMLGGGKFVPGFRVNAGMLKSKLFSRLLLYSLAILKYLVNSQILKIDWVGVLEEIPPVNEHI